jgi:hypothetical protein
MGLLNNFKFPVSNENKTLNSIFGCIALCILIAAAYLTFSQHAIANRISLWQAGFMSEKGKYFPALTICLLALPQLLLLLPVKLFILKIIRNKTIK